MIVSLQLPQDLPHFGEFEKKRLALIAEHKRQSELLTDEAVARIDSMRPAPLPTLPIPTVQQVIGQALNKIGNYTDLDNKQQVCSSVQR